MAPELLRSFQIIKKKSIKEHSHNNKNKNRVTGTNLPACSVFPEKARITYFTEEEEKKKNLSPKPPGTIGAETFCEQQNYKAVSCDNILCGFCNV